MRTEVAEGTAGQLRHRDLHSWNVSTQEAVAIQKRLAERVERQDRLGPVRHVAGVDIGFEAGGTVTRAAVAVLTFPQLELVESVLVRRPTEFPYIPGLLSFREIPAATEACEQLRTVPDLILCDGQGVAHPRRCGLACHLGLVLDVPTLGAAKSRLTGTHGDVPPERGAWVPLLKGEEVLGAVLRTRAGTKPLFVSTGHRVSLPAAIEYVLACSPRYRLPETTRQAHRLASDKSLSPTTLGSSANS